MAEKKMCPKGDSWEHCIQDRCQWWVSFDGISDCAIVYIPKMLEFLCRLPVKDP
jgi:hypothetical protein